MKEGTINDNKGILLVEDDFVDVMTVKRAIKKLKISNPLHHAGNGEDALELLESMFPETPSLILLDINMPKMNGIEFLKVIKQDDKFRQIPVIILTTSNNLEDRGETFDLSVAGYMVKPVEFERFLDMMEAIKHYWSLSQFPS